MFHEAPLIRTETLPLSRSENEMVAALCGLPFEPRCPEDSKSIEECFFGCVIGEDARNFLNAEEIKHIRINSKYRAAIQTEKISWTKFFEVGGRGRCDETGRQTVRKELDLIRDRAVLLLGKMLNEEIPQNVLWRNLQCNINKYRKGTNNVPHRDDVSPACKTFYPASVTCAFSTGPAPKILLYYPQGLGEWPEELRIPLNEKDAAVPNNSFVQVEKSGNGVLFGLSGYAYKVAKHRASTCWDTASFPDAVRISLNFRAVRDDLSKRLIEAGRRN